jgi:hypothetical protein
MVARARTLLCNVQHSLRPMNADEVLRRMCDVYASAWTYQDSGTAVFVGADGLEPPKALEGIFQTRFERSVGLFFRIEGLTAEPIVIRSSLQRATEVRGLKYTGESLGLAIAAATGVTFGVAYNVPRLLLPDTIPGRVPWTLHAAAIVGEEDEGGDVCSVIQVDNTLLSVSTRRFVLRSVTTSMDSVQARGALVERLGSIESVGINSSVLTVKYLPTVDK